MLNCYRIRSMQLDLSQSRFFSFFFYLKKGDLHSRSASEGNILHEKAPFCSNVYENTQGGDILTSLLTQSPTAYLYIQFGEIW